MQKFINHSIALRVFLMEFREIVCKLISGILRVEKIE